MKAKISGLIIGILILFAGATAQNLPMYGTTTSGGAYGGGTILKMNTDGSFNVEHSFQDPAGWFPMGNMTAASDGKLYGVCFEGGSYASCTIYCWDTITKVYNDVYDFDIDNGDFPTNTPVEVGNGILYGTGLGGGVYGAGVIYAYDIYNHTYSVVHDFEFDTLNYWTMPFGGLTLHSNGTLYGMTVAYGANGRGTLYSLVPGSNIFSELHDFDILTGEAPYGNLVEWSDGKLYGVTSGGGQHAMGVLFSFDPATNIYSTLHDFDSTNGGIPSGCLIHASDGFLYGLTDTGGNHANGVIFSFNPSSNAYAVVHHFDGIHGSMTGAMGNPISFLPIPLQGGLHESNGKLYGTAVTGGAYDFGVVFSLELANLNYTVMLDFDSATYGANPSAGFIIPENNGVFGAYISGQNLLCADSIITTTLQAYAVNSSGSSAYLWSTGATTSSIDVTTGIGTTDYSVTITDNGTSQVASNTYRVMVNPNPPVDFSITASEQQVSILYDTSIVDEFYIDYGDSSGNVQSLTHSYATGGTYRILVMALNSCNYAVIEKMVTVTGSVSIHPEPKALAFEFYPNPCNGDITVLLPAGEEKCMLTISDLSGKLLFEQEVNAAGELNAQQLNLAALSKGIYLMQLQSLAGKGTRKLTIY